MGMEFKFLKSITYAGDFFEYKVLTSALSDYYHHDAPL